MEVVIRPVNDRFLYEVAFPAFELGVVDAQAGLELLHSKLRDERTQTLLELLLDRGVSGSFFGLEEDKWVEAVYRLLFWEWVEQDEGWVILNEYTGFACDWEQGINLAMMLEDADYRYHDPTKAQLSRHAAFKLPDEEGPLTKLLLGVWDPVPAFPPDQVLATVGRALYRPTEGLAVADWSWRSLQVVNGWGAQLPNKLSRLLGRESRRLSPVEAPETHEILDYWLGRTEQAPTLAVTFSGLGAHSYGWIRDIGALARLVRSSAAAQQGLTAIVTQRGRAMFEGAPSSD
ncbi:MAG: hypothetical protein HYZ28_06040 [Myxococcales bacterium]|nr:hypothetical protein [Myxococcales bacterium]